ncbi:Acetolactate synthase small subunit [Eubacterium plexicaudatum ASF492]|nr:Acetolactate synthase small subunit [Eubacterium plexicaudatum ASF492]
MILVKLRVQESSRQEILSVIEIFRGKVVDVTRDSMVIELTGNQDKLSAFLDLVSGFEILELARTGITGLTRGSSDVTYFE